MLPLAEVSSETKAPKFCFLPFLLIMASNILSSSSSLKETEGNRSAIEPWKQLLYCLRLENLLLKSHGSVDPSLEHYCPVIPTQAIQGEKNQEA